MAIDETIRDKKLQHNVHREAAEASALSSGKIDKCEYLTGKEILPSDPSQMIEQTKFACSSIRKGFQKRIKTIEDR